VTLLASHVETDYIVEYGTVLVRDAFDEHAEVDRSAREAFDVACERWPTLGEHPARGDVSGTLARSGLGWLAVDANDAYHHVRLESHSAPPSPTAGEVTDWQDVLELPYVAGGDLVGLSWLTDGVGRVQLPLTRTGAHRVRVHRRELREPDPAEDILAGGWDYLLQFWPVEEPVELPRWHRALPDVDTGDVAVETWSLPHPLPDLLWVVEAAAGEAAAGGVDRLEIEGWAHRHGRGPGWLSRSLLDEPYQWPPTGHADLDEDNLRQQELQRVQAQARVLELHTLARQVGASQPSTIGDLLPVLTGLGLLARTGDRWSAPSAPPVALPGLLDMDAGRQQRMLWTGRVGDLCCLLAWAQMTGRPVTVASIAASTGASRADTRRCLIAAATDGLTLEGPIDDPDELLRFRWDDPPHSAKASPSTDVVADAPDARPRPAAGARWFGRPERDPWARAQVDVGPPPRAGVVDRSWQLIRYPRGQAVTVCRGENYATRAVETAHGVLFDGQLVTDDGQARPTGLDALGFFALSEDGTHVAHVEERTGRHPRWWLHLVDLADLTRTTMPWPERRAVSVVALHEGTVYFSGDWPGDEPQDPGGGVWQPGEVPIRSAEPLRAVDPLSGTRLLVDDEPGVLVVTPGHRARHVLLNEPRLVPGGRELFTLRYSPPAVTIFDVETGAAAARVHWLPPGTIDDVAGAVWEDRTHLLVAMRGDHPLVRVDVARGTVEAAGILSSGTGDHAAPVRPLLRKAATEQR